VTHWPRVRFFICVVVLAALQGCATSRESASVSPDIDLSRLKTFHVVRFAPDGRGIDRVIAAELRKLGFQASTGADDAAPKKVDAIVTYQDKWQWDLTMYMIELSVFVREPGTDDLLAVGKSFHTSLNRKTPEEMAAEVLANIFNKARKAPRSGR